VSVRVCRAALVEAGADVNARFTGPRILTIRVESTGPCYTGLAKCSGYGTGTAVPHGGVLSTSRAVPRRSCICSMLQLGG
jgi:hypothetical protein